QENNPSAVTSPSLIPKRFYICSMIRSAPTKQQGAVRQTSSVYLPVGCKKYMVQNVATSYTSIRWICKKAATLSIASLLTQPYSACTKCKIGNNADFCLP